MNSYSIRIALLAVCAGFATYTWAQAQNPAATPGAPIAAPALTPPAADQPMHPPTFKEMDKAGDGKVTFQEFLDAFMPKMQEQYAKLSAEGKKFTYDQFVAKRTEALKERFDKMTNGTGILTLEAWKAAREQHNERHAGGPTPPPPTAALATSGALCAPCAGSTNAPCASK